MRWDEYLPSFKRFVSNFSQLFIKEIVKGFGRCGCSCHRTCFFPTHYWIYFYRQASLLNIADVLVLGPLTARPVNSYLSYSNYFSVTIIMDSIVCLAKLTSSFGQRYLRRHFRKMGGFLGMLYSIYP